MRSPLPLPLWVGVRGNDDDMLRSLVIPTTRLVLEIIVWRFVDIIMVVYVWTKEDKERRREKGFDNPGLPIFVRLHDDSPETIRPPIYYMHL